jgi:hypothetical protein
MNKRFEPPVRCALRGCGMHHFHQEDWKAYKASLSEAEMQSLRDKARWEQMSLSAVAMSWGALVEVEQ